MFSVVVSILPHAKFGRNYHQEDALHFVVKTVCTLIQMSISELLYRELENGKIITVNFICEKLKNSKQEGFEILRKLTNLFEQRNLNFVLLKQIVGKRNERISCRLVKSCDLEKEKKLFQSIHCISGWLVR